MILTPSQALIAKSKARFRVVNCGRRFGKTSHAILEIVGKAVSKDNQKVVFIANTYQQARDIAWRELKKICLGIAVNVNEARLEIEIKTQDGGTSLIWLRGWESVDTLRGQGFHFVVIDEVASMRNFWENWQEVIRPTLTDTRGEVLFLSTPKGFNHFYDLFNLGSTDVDYKSFHFTTYDNPHVPREEIEKAKQELTEDRFSQEYLADFRKTEGLVYPEFSRDRHLFDGSFTINEYEKIAGVDFGYTHQAAVPTIVIDLSGKYWVTEEWYKTGQTEEQIADYVANKRFQRVYPDPESPSAIETMKRKGVNVREVVKNKDSVKSGINVIRELLKANRLKIHWKCINLINEFETYSYPDEDKNQRELPVKENDHLLDALRYALATSEKVVATPLVAKQYSF